MAIWVDADACPNVIKRDFIPRRRAYADLADAGCQPAAAGAAIAGDPHAARAAGV